MSKNRTPTFEACDWGDTFLIAGFIVAGGGCYPVVAITGDGVEHTAHLPVEVFECH